MSSKNINSKSEEELIAFFKEKRKDFPILNQKVNGHDLVYADNCATSQKPKCVIDEISNFYLNYNSNVHRGIHTLSEMATEKYEEVRDKVAKFINCDRLEVVFTKGTTDGLNMVVFGFEGVINEGDEIVLAEPEHHANMVPWQVAAKKKGAKLKFIPLKKDFTLDMDKARELITSKTKFVSVAHVSNVLGSVNPVFELAKLAHDKGAFFVLDGAQSVPHMKIDVKKLDCDFLVFSSHKMCGPTGVGVLYGKKEFLERMIPMEYGGDMIYEVGFDKFSLNKVPYRFEAGTPDIEGVIAFGRAIDYLSGIGMEKIEEYEYILTEYFLEKVKDLKDFVLFGPQSAEDRCAVFSFNISGIHAHDMSTIFDKKGVAIRGGHHCAMPLTKVLDVCATSRISLYFYNTLEEIDFIVKILKEAKKLYEEGGFL